MAGHQISYVDNSTMLAHYAMLAAIQTFANLHGWTTLRYDTSGTNHELILRSFGLSGTEMIYVGFRTYHDVFADYYNLVAAGFTGYVSSSQFDAQPGARLSGVPAHNNRIDYWLTVNAQRIVLAMKVGTPVYEHAYVGKMFPYALPGQYPYPLVCVGSLDGASATRFSETTHFMGYRGVVYGSSHQGGLRNPGGAWSDFYAHPWSNTALCGTTQLRPIETNYTLEPVILHDNVNNLWGELDGIYMISGFNNAVENTISLSGVDYVVMQDVWRTGFYDYYAMRLD